MSTSSRPGSSEIQLYRVLQRANLLAYYDTFIAQGGDDVQQLCEAGEDEFLEIMALVGMASKPLHVRRLQKTLQDWVTNPGSFVSDRHTATPIPGSISAVAQQQGYTVHSTSQSNPASSWSGSSNASVSPTAQDNSQETKPLRLTTSPNLFSANLSDEQVAAISAAAERLATNLPMFPPKDLNPKKGINRELLEVMMMTDETAGRMEKLRKYAAIYGRFDSKRKNDRPMSLHELSVNEASAQLCRFVPALLSRREDLFPLARQVVRDSGYQYSKGHSSSNPRSESNGPTPKKIKLDNSFNTWLIDQLQKPVKTDHNGNKEVHIQELSIEIKDIRDKIEMVRAMIQEAKERNDSDSLAVLQGRIENLTARQITLLHELEEYTQLPDSAPGVKTTSNGAGGDDEYLSDSSNLQSGASSPAPVSESGAAKPSVITQSNPPLPAMTNPMDDSNLFDEGLRIAQQYGLADFAEELKELQQQSGDDDKSVKNAGTESNYDDVKRNYMNVALNFACGNNREVVNRLDDGKSSITHKTVKPNTLHESKLTDNADDNITSSQLEDLVKENFASSLIAKVANKVINLPFDREAEVQQTFSKSIVVNHKVIPKLNKPTDEKNLSSNLLNSEARHIIHNHSPTSISIQTINPKKPTEPTYKSQV